MDVRRVPPILQVEIGDGKLNDEWRRRTLEQAKSLSVDNGDSLMQELIEEEMRKLRAKETAELLDKKNPN